MVTYKSLPTDQLLNQINQVQKKRNQLSPYINRYTTDQLNRLSDDELFNWDKQNQQYQAVNNTLDSLWTEYGKRGIDKKSLYDELQNIYQRDLTLRMFPNRLIGDDELMAQSNRFDAAAKSWDEVKKKDKELVKLRQKEQEEALKPLKERQERLLNDTKSIEKMDHTQLTDDDGRNYLNTLDELNSLQQQMDKIQGKATDNIAVPVAETKPPEELEKIKNNVTQLTDVNKRIDQSVKSAEGKNKTGLDNLSDDELFAYFNLKDQKQQNEKEIEKLHAAYEELGGEIAYNWDRWIALASVGRSLTGAEREEANKAIKMLRDNPFKKWGKIFGNVKENPKYSDIERELLAEALESRTSYTSSFALGAIEALPFMKKIFNSVDDQNQKFAYEKMSDDEQLINLRKNYRPIENVRNNSDTAYQAGDIAGTVLLTVATGEAIGNLMKGANLVVAGEKMAQAVNTGVTFATVTGIKGASNILNKDQWDAREEETAQQYAAAGLAYEKRDYTIAGQVAQVAAEAAITGGAAALGSLASSEVVDLVSKGLGEVGFKIGVPGLNSSAAARALMAAVGGGTFGLTTTATQQAVKWAIQGDRYQLDTKQAAKDILVGIGFGIAGEALKYAKTSNANKALYRARLNEAEAGRTALRLATSEVTPEMKADLTKNYRQSESNLQAFMKQHPEFSEPNYISKNPQLNTEYYRLGMNYNANQLCVAAANKSLTPQETIDLCNTVMDRTGTAYVGLSKTVAPGAATEINSTGSVLAETYQYANDCKAAAQEAMKGAVAPQNGRASGLTAGSATQGLAPYNSGTGGSMAAIPQASPSAGMLAPARAPALQTQAVPEASTAPTEAEAYQAALVGAGNKYSVKVTQAKASGTAVAAAEPSDVSTPMTQAAQPTETAVAVAKASDLNAPDSGQLQLALQRTRAAQAAGLKPSRVMDVGEAVVLPEAHYDTQMSAVAKSNLDKGYKTVYFLDDLPVKVGDTTLPSRGFMDLKNGTMYLKVNNAVSVESLAKHEEYHAKSALNPGKTKLILAEVAKQTAPGSLESMVRKYQEAYNGCYGSSPYGYLDEIAADAYANINGMGRLISEVKDANGLTTRVESVETAGAGSRDSEGAAALWRELGTNSPYFKDYYDGNTPELYGQDGKPITVFHGTASPIEAFDTAKRGSMTRADDAKLGFFFTSSPETATGYANNALPQDLIAARDNYEALQEKWGESDDPKVAKDYRTAEKKYELMMADYRTGGNDGTVMEVYLSMKNPLVTDMKGAAYQGNGAKYREAIEQAKAEGHDGVIFKNVYDSVGGEKYRKKSDVYVVFQPEQVKSVGNVGTFDRANPNVRYSVNTDGNVEDGGNISVAKDGEEGYNGSRNKSGSEKTKFAYKNNPMDNPKAAKDIVENPNAVYGYSPNPKSDRIGKFAELDWTNKDVVSSAREARLQYHKDNESIYNLVKKMQHDGATVEEIARAANQQRNLNRLRRYIDTGNMSGYKKAVESNIKNFQNKLGMTAEQAYDRYGSWDIVLEKAMSANAGMDACCGLYDEFNYLY